VARRDARIARRRLGQPDEQSFAGDVGMRQVRAGAQQAGRGEIGEIGPVAEKQSPPASRQPWPHLLDPPRHRVP
jgi:hypothetical protein